MVLVHSIFYLWFWKSSSACSAKSSADKNHSGSLKSLVKLQTRTIGQILHDSCLGNLLNTYYIEHSQPSMNIQFFIKRLLVALNSAFWVIWAARPEVFCFYSHLFNKRGVTLIDFEKKIHPPHTFPPSMFIYFIDTFIPTSSAIGDKSKLLMFSWPKINLKLKFVHYSVRTKKLINMKVKKKIWL